MTLTISIFIYYIFLIYFIYRCECNSGWISDNITDSCNTCDSLYYGPDCKECRNIINKDNILKPCNGNGICNGSGSIYGNGVCICDEEYRGDGCESCNCINI